MLYSLFTSGFVYFYSFHGLRRVAGEKTAMKDLVIGAIAGAINVLSTTPLWVVNTRIRMQDTQKYQKISESNIQVKTEERYSGLIDGLCKIIRAQGPGALWSGTAPSLILVTNPAIQFMIFEMLKRNMQKMIDKKELSPFHIFTLGAISKSVSTVISYPLQIVQSKKRYGSAEVKNKSMAAILANLAQEGNLYKGLEAKLLQTVMTTALMYVFYEKIYSFVTRASKSI